MTRIETHVLQRPMSPLLYTLVKQTVFLVVIAHLGEGHCRARMWLEPVPHPINANRSN